MLDVYEAMRTLRTIRRLKPDPIPGDVLRRVLEAASYAPTGGNVQPWRVIVVRDAAKKARLQQLYAKRWHDYVAHYAKLVAGQPPEAVAATQKTLASGNHLAAHLHEAPVLLVFCFNPEIMAITDSALERVSVVGGASIYTAVENALLACRAEGLGCTLTTLLCQDEPELCALLEIPKPWATACVVPIGWPLSGSHGPLKRRPVEKLAFVDAWGRAFPG